MKKILYISLLGLLSIHLFTIDAWAQDGKIDGKTARKEMRSGNKAYREQLYGTAEGKYAAAIKADPTNSAASYNLANTYYKQQRWDDALKEYQHYLTLENQDPKRMSQAWSSIGNTYLRKKANEKAANKAGMQQGQPQQPQQQGGEQAQQADNLKMSMEAYKNSLRLNPSDNDTRYNLAVVQKMIQDQKQDGGGDNQKQDKDKKDQDKKDQNQDKDQNQPKQDKQQDQNSQNQMSQDNAQQILQALEQEEKQTQERVKGVKARERQRQNENNRKQGKDW